MLTKAQEIKKAEEEAALKDQAGADDAQDGKGESDTDDDDAAGEADTESTETTATGDEKETAEGEEGEKSAKTTLQKVEALGKELEKINPEVTASKKEALDLTKSVNAMAGVLSKVVSLIKKQDERIAQLEATPAAAKSKVATVFKGEEDEAEKTQGEKKASGELTAKRARLTELNDIFEKIGPVQFAKDGHSKEASKLMGEIENLERRA